MLFHDLCWEMAATQGSGSPPPTPPHLRTKMRRGARNPIAVHLGFCGLTTLSKKGLFQVRFHPHPALPRERFAAGEGSQTIDSGLCESL